MDFFKHEKKGPKIPEGAERKRQNDIDKHDFSDGENNQLYIGSLNNQI